MKGTAEYQHSTQKLVPAGQKGAVLLCLKW